MAYYSYTPVRRFSFQALTAAGPQHYLIAIVGVATLLRFWLAATLPLSFDEAYFWLWSKHLALSYYDHPPMIALAIRLGTALLGDTEFGTRFVSLILSVAASWAIWRAARILLIDASASALAVCFFNAMLMVAAESMSATPDAIVLAASAFLLLSVAKLEQTHDGRWWVGVAVALGSALLSKYTAFFLVCSVALYLFATREGRVWLISPWLYLAVLASALSCIPNLVWNAQHDWISFRFQFGRVTEGGLTLQYLMEFVAGQIVLASPFILILAVAAVARELRQPFRASRLFFAASLVLPGLLYFGVHALHARVQGNWPSFIYPGLAVLASAGTLHPPAHVRLLRVWKFSCASALPAAFIILLMAYAQAAFGVLAMGRSDPIARMTGVGLTSVAQEISAIARRERATAIVTSRYVVTGWLSFYLNPRAPIIQIGEDRRWLEAPLADAHALHQRLLYVTQEPQRELPTVAAHFSKVKFVARLDRTRKNTVIDHFYLYSLSGLRGQAVGRAP